MDPTLKSYASIWKHLARKCHQVKDTDIATFNRRLDYEGLPFLTTIMPRLGADVLSALKTGNLVVSARFRLKRGTALPVFLNGMWTALFEPDGTLRECTEERAYTLGYLRQLTQLAYKLEVTNEELDEIVLKAFIDRDRDLIPETIDRTRERTILSRLLSGEDPEDIVPMHGSGATACRTPNHAKWHRFRYIPRLDMVYPYTEHFFISPTHLADELFKLDQAEVVDPPARVTLVPKDSRGQRVISMEPRELMFVQQGLMRKLYRLVETHPLTAGYVNFTDQTINGELARLGSISGKYATIDLKDASDRVSLDLVRKIFPSNWVRCFEATRSRWTEVPGHGEIELKKFAPMGSALCFPVEALTFWVLLRVSLRGPVWVYGDDIIVLNEEYELACRTLTDANMQVNEAKSYATGLFRESCGKDYWGGYDVGYVKLRHDFNRRTLIESCAFVNNITKRWGENSALQDWLYSQTGVHFPREPLHYIDDAKPLTIYSDRLAANVLLRRRWRSGYQRHEYKVPVFRTRKRAYRKAQKYHWCEFFRKHLTHDKHGLVGEYTAPDCTVGTGWRPLSWSANP